MLCMENCMSRGPTGKYRKESSAVQPAWGGEGGRVNLTREKKREI